MQRSDFYAPLFGLTAGVIIGLLFTPGGAIPMLAFVVGAMATAVLMKAPWEMKKAGGVSVTFPEDARAWLEHLVQDSNSFTRAEALTKAANLYNLILCHPEWIKIQDGKQFVCIQAPGGGFVKILLP